MESHPSPSSKSYNLLQWNLNGFHTRNENLKLLLNRYQSEVVCLQETHLKSNNTIKTFKGFNIFTKNRVDCLHANGGVAVLIKIHIQSMEISLCTTLEAIAINTGPPLHTTICNIYIPNRQSFDIKMLNELLEQLLKPFILVKHSPITPATKITQVNFRNIKMKQKAI